LHKTPPEKASATPAAFGFLAALVSLIVSCLFPSEPVLGEEKFVQAVFFTFCSMRKQDLHAK
jgi:hypothetical protein